VAPTPEVDEAMLRKFPNAKTVSVLPDIQSVGEASTRDATTKSARRGNGVLPAIPPAECVLGRDSQQATKRRPRSGKHNNKVRPMSDVIAPIPPLQSSEGKGELLRQSRPAARPSNVSSSPFQPPPLGPIDPRSPSDLPPMRSSRPSMKRPVLKKVMVNPTAGVATGQLPPMRGSLGLARPGQLYEDTTPPGDGLVGQPPPYTSPTPAAEMSTGGRSAPQSFEFRPPPQPVVPVRLEPIALQYSKTPKGRK